MIARRIVKDWTETQLAMNEEVLLCRTFDFVDFAPCFQHIFDQEIAGLD